MTIYIVEHTFARPDTEDEWNAWYAGNLKVLLSVPGFRTGQRFKMMGARPSRYMAVYTLDSPAILESAAYREAGGGGANSRRFRDAYQVWIRNLFEGAEYAPDVRTHCYLAAVDRASPDSALPDPLFIWLKAVGLHLSTPYRALAAVTPEELARVRQIAGVAIYRPITAQHRPAVDLMSRRISS